MALGSRLYPDYLVRPRYSAAIGWQATLWPSGILSKPSPFRIGSLKRPRGGKIVAIPGEAIWPATVAVSCYKPAKGRRRARRSFQKKGLQKVLPPAGCAQFQMVISDSSDPANAPANGNASTASPSRVGARPEAHRRCCRE